MSYTPGPWHWVNDDTDEPWDGETPHASLRTVEEFGETKLDGPRFSFRLPKFIIDYAEGINSVDDADLIASAPQQQGKIDALLLAAKAAQRWAYDFFAGQPMEPSWLAAMDAAITKAEDKPDDRDATAHDIEQGYADYLLAQTPRDEA